MSTSSYRVSAFILFVLLFLSTWAAVFAERGYLDWRRMVRRSDHVTKQIELTHREIERLEREIKAIETDPAVQERWVRAQLGYIHDGESVVELD